MAREGIFDPSFLVGSWFDPDTKLAGWFSDDAVEIVVAAGSNTVYKSARTFAQVSLGPRTKAQMYLGVRSFFP